MLKKVKEHVKISIFPDLPVTQNLLVFVWEKEKETLIFGVFLLI